MTDDKTAPVERIAIIGCPGAGKSTLAKAIGERLGLPVTHLDALWWNAGWVEGEKADFDRKLAQAAAADRWVIDGNYGRTYHLRLPRADTVVWMDFPTPVCLWRIFRRWFAWRGRSRPDMTAGCPEHLSLEFLVYVATFRGRNRLILEHDLATHGANARVIRLRSSGDAAKFLATLEEKNPSNDARP